MHVLLLHPNFDAPLGVSIGLSCIAAVLKRAGHRVSALHVAERLDYPFDLDRIVEDVRAADPGLVAITSGFNHYPEMRAVIEAVATRLAIPVLLGGIHATLNADRVLEENPRLEFLNVGEGEESTLELVEALERGRDPSGIANLQVRRGASIHRNRVRPFLDLGTLPSMETEMWSFQRVCDLRRGWVNVSAQRGCPYRCPYCHNHGVARVLASAMRRPSSSNADLGYLRVRPPARLIDELCSLKARWRMRAFSFIDDTFTMNPDWLEDFLPRYGRLVRTPFVCNTTAVDLDERILSLLADAGCRLVRLGVEAGSDRLLQGPLKRGFIGKDKLRWAFRSIESHGMMALAYLMIGNLDETRSETLETFRHCAELRPTSIKLSLAQPYPGTGYHDEALAREALDARRSTHNFIESSVIARDGGHALWLDKVRSFYFWFVNAELGNAGSPQFRRLAAALESLPDEKWSDPEARRELWNRHAALSEDLRERGIEHYTAPFDDRADIVVSSHAIVKHEQLLGQEANEPH